MSDVRVAGRVTAPQFGSHVDTLGRQTQVALWGELDLQSAGALGVTLTGLVADGERSIVVDLRDLAFIDVAGAAPLAVAHRDLVRRGGTLSFRSPGQLARHVLAAWELERGITDEVA